MRTTPSAARAVRFNRDLRLTEVLLESFLSQVERGIANPWVASLRRIAEALGEPVVSFFVGTESRGMVVRAGEMRRMPRPRGAYQGYLLTPPSAPKLQIIQLVIEPARTRARSRTRIRVTRTASS
jgi:transcriptional regulator with XRE-family HTH domain